jgi:hypothetical protein
MVLICVKVVSRATIVQDWQLRDSILSKINSIKVDGASILSILALSSEQSNVIDEEVIDYTNVKNFRNI